MLGLVVASCSKDQKVVNQLEGDWKVTSVKYNGVEDTQTDYSMTTYTFEKCKVKNGPCSGKLVTSDETKGSITFNFKYEIFEDGEKIRIEIDFLGLDTEEQVGDIIENSKDKFVWSVTDEDGDKMETTIEKK